MNKFAPRFQARLTEDLLEISTIFYGPMVNIVLCLALLCFSFPAFLIPKHFKRIYLFLYRIKRNVNISSLVFMIIVENLFKSYLLLLSQVEETRADKSRLKYQMTVHKNKLDCFFLIFLAVSQFN